MSAESSVDFLKANTRADFLVLYASLDAVLIHAALAPLENLDPPDQDGLRRDFIATDDSWIIEHTSGGGQPDRVYLEPPLRRLGRTFINGEKLVFIRSFEGTGSSQIEVNQKLVHALNLHFIEERNAYCRLDADGDIEDVIKIVEERKGDWRENVTVVAVLANDIAKYIRLAGMGLVFFFDFTRVRRGGFGGWSDARHFNRRALDLFYDGGILGDEASYVNGRMIVRPEITYDDIVTEYMERRNPSRREYARFRVLELRTKSRIEASCDPNELSNYFQPDSPLPLEMSPVFFKPEVLHKYKADPEKYELLDRSIRCRGTWSLETFDINSEGQVHTYLRYLNRLPYKEQIYWQSFNEWPKGPISRRALTTDFKGDFYEGSDPLNTLKQRTMELDRSRPPWWQPRGEALLRLVHLPATTSPEEWANEILALDHLVNEGFQLKPLKKLAEELGCALAPDWKVFKLLEEVLRKTGIDENDAKGAVSALRVVRELRNSLKGHAALAKRRELERLARKEFGTFRAHFEGLAANAEAALGLIVRALTQGGGSEVVAPNPGEESL